MSVVINDFSVNGAFPATVGGTGTTVKYFPRLLGSSIGVESTTPSATNANGQLVVPGFNALNGQNFEVWCGGAVTSGVSDSSVTIAVGLYAQTSQTNTSPTYTLLATTGNVTAPLASTSYNFAIRATFQGTTASGVVRGSQYSILGTTQNTTAALTNNLSGINFGLQQPFGLVVGVTFNSSDTGNSASLYQFQVLA